MLTNILETLYRSCFGTRLWYYFLPCRNFQRRSLSRDAHRSASMSARIMGKYFHLKNSFSKLTKAICTRSIVPASQTSIEVIEYTSGYIREISLSFIVIIWFMTVSIWTKRIAQLFLWSQAHGRASLFSKTCNRVLKIQMVVGY